jgi:hypothetical protein
MSFSVVTTLQTLGLAGAARLADGVAAAYSRSAAAMRACQVWWSSTR